MAIAMVAMLAFGGTYAYFTASADSYTGTATTGIVALTDGDTVVYTGTGMVDGDTLLSTVTYNVGTTNVKSIVIVNFALAMGEGETATIAELFGEDATVNTSAWTELEDGFYYQVYDPTIEAKADEDLEEGEKKFDGSFITKALVLEAEPEWVEGQTQPKEMGADIEITLAAKSIQYKGLTGDTDAARAASAKTELFGA